MPIYEYSCTDCGHAFEAMQKISDDPIKVCPSCGAEKVRKLVSATSFVLKGGGWYSDHYGLKGGSEGKSEGKPEGKSEGSPKAESKAESSPKAESAPAPAPAAAKSDG